MKSQLASFHVRVCAADDRGHRVGQPREVDADPADISADVAFHRRLSGAEDVPRHAGARVDVGEVRHVLHGSVVTLGQILIADEASAAGTYELM